MTTNQVYQDGQGNVSGDALNTFVQTCPTVAYARNFVGITGMEMALQGTNVSGDGGDGTFYWNAGNMAADDDGVTTIVPYGSGSGAWTRLSQAIKWTPVDASGAGLTFTVNSAYFLQQQALCLATLDITFPPTGNASAVAITGFPSAPASVYTNSQIQAPLLIASTSEQTACVNFSAGVAQVQFVLNSSGVLIPNSTVSNKRVTTSLVFFA